VLRDGARRASLFTYATPHSSAAATLDRRFRDRVFHLQAVKARRMSGGDEALRRRQVHVVLLEMRYILS